MARISVPWHSESCTGLQLQFSFKGWTANTLPSGLPGRIGEGARLNFDERPELNYLLGRKIEVVRRGRGILGRKNKHRLAPSWQPGFRRGHRNCAPHEIGHAPARCHRYERNQRLDLRMYFDDIVLFRHKGRTGAMKLLLVEDDPMVGGLLKTALSEAGYGVELCENAECGELAMRLEAFDAVVLDLGLPDKSGLDVLKSLRRAQSE